MAREPVLQKALETQLGDHGMPPTMLPDIHAVAPAAAVRPVGATPPPTGVVPVNPVDPRELRDEDADW